MRITSAGDVGIGTSTPDGKLTVRGQTILGLGVADSANLTNLVSGTPPQLIAGWTVPPITWSPSTATEAVFTRDGDMTVDILASNTASSILNFSDTDDENAGYLEYDHAGNFLRIGTVGTERVRIASSGNVGIGTTSPAQKLSVAGTIESTSGGFKFPDGTVQTTAGGAGVGAVAFARINQSTVLSSYNISSVAVGGANAVVTFATALQDANYAPLVSPSLNSTAQFGNSGSTASTHAITASNFQIYGRGYTGSNNTSYGYGGVFNAMAIAVFR